MGRFLFRGAVTISVSSNLANMTRQLVGVKQTKTGPGRSGQAGPEEKNRPSQIGASRARNKALALRYRIRLGG